MADHFYGVDLGAAFGAGGVSTGTSTTSKGVELRVADGVSGNNKTEVLKAIENLVAKITTDNAPA
jgi:hypothetical protein